MRTRLFMGIGLALSFSVQAADDRCMVTFDAAQMDVCSGKISVAHPALEPLASLKEVRNSTLRLIKFAGPITEADRAAVEASGAEILGYAPEYAFIVRANPDTAKPARISPRVVWTGPFLPAFKIDLNILNELQFGNVVREGGVEELEISLHPNAQRAAVEQVLNATPGLRYTRTVNAGKDVRLHARFDNKLLAASVTQLALNPDVAAIGFRWPVQLLNSQADWLHQSNVNSPSPLTPVFNRGIYGCGQVVGEFDTGIHMAHCSFNDAAQPPVVNACSSGASCPPITAPNNAARKVTAYYKWSGLSGTAPTDNHGHGTHVAGSVAGQNPANAVDCANLTTPGGNTDLDGTAPGAKIVMQESGGNLAYVNSQGGNPYHAADMAYLSGARLHTNSWGGGCVNPQTRQCIANCTITYDALSRDADNIARDRSDLVVLYAAGNDGTICANGYNVGTPGNSKNVITIGATERGTAANAMASFSSRGPTNDSRTKPDLTAQGANIISAARNACGTAPMSGTSMATPTAAGLAALVRDYLARGFYPTGAKVAANAINNPSGALIKAILISGASTMTGTGASTAPGQSQGWGRIHLDNSLYFNGDASRLYIHDAPTGLATGGVDTHTITVTAGQPLNVTLAWTDAAAAVNANPALVNALRLEVVAPNGDVWTQKLPSGVNVNNANPTQSIATTGYDNRNNVHRISFANPTAGTYTVRVVGINVPTGPQKYGLAATGNFTFGGSNGFTLQANPTSVSVCAGSNASYTIGAQSVGTFTSPVALSITGVPSPATSGFSPASVVPANPAATSALTIGNTSGVASGNYNLVITGTSTSPAMTQTASATLNVTAAVTGAGTLSAPANGATSTSTTPAFSWAAISGASSYRIQVATDSGFTNLVVNQVVTGTSFTPSTALANNTQHYWRVYGINGCGQGPASSAFSFTTAPVVANYCRTPNVAIPDNNTTGVTDSQSVTTTGTLTNLRLSFNITHSYMGDVTLILTKGSTSVTLLQRPGNASNTGTSGCSGDNGSVIVDNAATQTLEANCVNSTPAYTTGASYKPNNPFTPFIGQPLNGTWSLRALDGAGTDTGTLVQWCLLPTL